MATRVIAVTGSASGMGLATATSLANSGYHLALWDTNSSRLAEVANSLQDQCSGTILAQTVDVSDRSAVKAALAWSYPTFSRRFLRDDYSGAIDTPMFHQVRNNAGLSSSASNTPFPRPGQPREVANVATFLLSEQSIYVTGAVWNVDGGANA